MDTSPRESGSSLQGVKEGGENSLERDEDGDDHHEDPEDREEDPDLHRRVLDLHDLPDDLVQLPEGYRRGGDPRPLLQFLHDLLGYLLHPLLGIFHPVVHAVETEGDPDHDHEDRDPEPGELTCGHCHDTPFQPYEGAAI